MLSNNGTAPPVSPAGTRALTNLGNTDPADGYIVGIVDLTTRQHTEANEGRGGSGDRRTAQGRSGHE